MSSNYNKTQYVFDWPQIFPKQFHYYTLCLWAQNKWAFFTIIDNKPMLIAWGQILHAFYLLPSQKCWNPCGMFVRVWVAEEVVIFLISSSYRLLFLSVWWFIFNNLCYICIICKSALKEGVHLFVCSFFVSSFVSFCSWKLTLKKTQKKRLPL